jgi:carboxylate-amine ligase
VDGSHAAWETATSDRWVRLEPEATPDWIGDRPDPLPPQGDSFVHPHGLTVGIEEEVMLLDPETFDLAPAVDLVLDNVPDDPRFTRELREAEVEILTPVAGNAHAVGLHLARARIDLQAPLDGRIALAVAGTHPFSTDWGAVVPGTRYALIADEHAFAANGNIPCGLHVHVGVDGDERALAVFNAARSYLPEIAALAANSPFAAGVDSGLASARRPLSAAFHRSGVPPSFPSWQSFDELVAWGRTGGLFPDATHFWWDLRPHPRYGTLELRVADAQTRVEDATAITAVFQSLVGWLLERHDAGEALATHPTERIRENIWRAMRYGVRGWMVDLDTGEPTPARARISALLDDVEPNADRLGNGSALLAARALVADNGAERQRYVAAETGLTGLARWLAAETRASAVDYLGRRA